MAVLFGKLILLAPGGQEQEFALGKATVTLGRATTNDIVLYDPKVSRFHARMECEDSGCFVEDLGSANPVCVNGAPIKRAALSPGDVLTLGDSVLRFESPNIESAAERTLAEVPSPRDQAELERTLALEGLARALTDTSVPRVAVRLAPRTWEVPLIDSATLIGRARTCDIVLRDSRVSRVHARLEKRATDVWVVDLGSRNGTLVEGQRIQERRLETGSELRIGSARLVFKDAVRPDDLTLAVSQPIRRTGRPVRRTPVVIVPGFMGSQLWRGQKRIWPDVRAMLTGPDLYRWPDRAGTEARGVIGDYVIIPNFLGLAQYSRLVEFFLEELGYRRGENLLEFAYDWRQDNRLSANDLARTVGAWCAARGHGEVALIAHSMGCLVSRYYVERLGGRDRVRRLILVGGPQSGTPKTFQAFTAMRGLLAFGQFAARFQQVVATFPSVYQVLPSYTCVFNTRGAPMDIFKDDSWLPQAYRPYLKSAAGFFKELGRGSSVPTVCVFGYGLRTPVKLIVECADSGPWKSALLEVADDGDDTVPQDSAMVEGADIHPVQQYHGSLYVDNDVKMRLKLDLLR